MLVLQMEGKKNNQQIQVPFLSCSKNLSDLDCYSTIKLNWERALLKIGNMRKLQYKTISFQAAIGIPWT